MCNSNKNCGCEKNIQICNTCQPEIPCDCPIVDLDSKCVLYTDEDIQCNATTVITSNLNLSDNLKNLVAYICQRFSEVQNYFRVINVGAGSEIYAGDNLLGHKKLRTLTSTNNSVTITEGENTVDFSVVSPVFNQNNFVRQLLVNEIDLPEDYTTQDIIDYILDLPANQRTILETDSKWNIVVYETSS